MSQYANIIRSQERMPPVAGTIRSSNEIAGSPASRARMASATRRGGDHSWSAIGEHDHGQIVSHVEKCVRGVAIGAAVVGDVPVAGSIIQARPI